jgi:hypothetical protein
LLAPLGGHSGRDPLDVEAAVVELRDIAGVALICSATEGLKAGLPIAPRPS